MFYSFIDFVIPITVPTAAGGPVDINSWGECKTIVSDIFG